MKRLLRWLAITVTAVLLLGLLTVALVGGLAGTESGTRLLVQTIPKVVPQLQLDYFNGKLLSRLELSNLQFDDDAQQLRVEHLVFSWRPRALLNRTLHVEQVALTRVAHKTLATDKAQTEQQTADFQLPERVDLPVDIVLEQLLVTDLTLESANDKQHVERIEIGARTNDSELIIDNVAIDHSTASAELSGSLALAMPYETDLAIAWRTHLDELGNAQGQGSLRGTQQSLELEHELQGPFSATTRLVIRPMDNPVAGELEIFWQDAHWPLEGQRTFTSKDGGLTITGNPEDFTLSLQGAVESADVPISHAAITLEGGAATAPPHAMSGEFTWSLSPHEGEPVEGNGSLEGDIEALRFQHVVENPFRITTKGDATVAGVNTAINIKGDWQDLRWPITSPVHQSAMGDFRLNGTLDAFEFVIDANASSDAVDIENFSASLGGGIAPNPPHAFDTSLTWRAGFANALELTGQAHASGSQDAIAFEHALSGAANLNSKGNINFADGTAFDVTSDWQSIRWPLSGTPQMQSSGGNVSLKGTMEDYRVNATLNAEVAQLPPVAVQLALNGNLQSAMIETLNVDTLGGQIRATGPVQWEPHTAATFTIDATAINPGEHWVELAGNLALAAKVDGTIEDDLAKFALTLDRLDGTFRGYPVYGAGVAALDGSDITSDRFTLRSGDNTLDAKGSVSDNIELAFTVDGSNLAQLWPGLSGRLTASGKVLGAKTNPSIELDMQANQVAFEDAAIAALSANVVLDPGDAERSKTQLRITGARVAGTTVSSAEVLVDGNLSEHDVSLDLASDVADANLALSGTLDSGTWSGTVSALSLRQQELGEWRLLDAVAAQAGPGNAQLERACIANKEATLCAEGRFDKTAGVSASGTLENISLALARARIPDNIDIEGVISGRFEAEGLGDELTATSELSLDKGAMSFESSTDKPVTVVFNEAKLEASYGPNAAASAQFAFALDRDGVATGAIRATPSGDVLALEGKVEADFPDLSLVEAFAPQLTQVRGGLSLGITVAGDTTAPVLSGEMSIKDASAAVPDAGIELSDIAFRASSASGQKLAITSSLKSGDGGLALDGEVTLDPEAGWPAVLTLKGENFESVRLPEAQAVISPTLELKTGTDGMSVTGDVLIPRAVIQVSELPEGSVAVSSDEVIVDEQVQSETQSGNAAPLSTRINIKLGDDVRFSGFGLKTTLQGNFEVLSEPNEAPTAQGILDLIDGEYTGFGQQLTIERGRLLFSGPLENPGLDLVATRTTDEVKAGLDVSGTAKNPRSRVFSEPALPDAEALSYLMTGRPLSGGGGDDNGQVLSQAAIGLGIEGARSIVQQVGLSVGLDELSVDQSALALGKYLTPDLYIRYAIGLFDSAGAAELSYRITDSLKLQGSAGTGQSVDLIYQIERARGLW